MLIQYPLDDTVDIDDIKYSIDASFDNVLRVIDLMNDNRVREKKKITVALEMLTDNKFEDYSNEEKAIILEVIMKKYVSVKPAVVRDLQGNIMPVVEEEIYFDYSKDSDLIYAAFMQAYGIDLIDSQGKLHWLKFKALMNGLPENTKLVHVIGIRSWKPSDDKRSRNEVMIEAQRRHKLGGEED